MERTKMPKLWNGSKGGFEPGLTWLRVRRSTAELLRSAIVTILFCNPTWKHSYINIQYYHEFVTCCDEGSRMATRRLPMSPRLLFNNHCNSSNIYMNINVHVKDRDQRWHCKGVVLAEAATVLLLIFIAYCDCQCKHVLNRGNEGMQIYHAKTLN